VKVKKVLMFKNIELRDLVCSFYELVEPLITADTHKYSLTKDSIINKFAIYRFVEFLISAKSKKMNKRLAFYVDSTKLKNDLLGNNLKIYKKLCLMLNVKIIEKNIDFEEYSELLDSSSGKGKEERLYLLHKTLEPTKNSPAKFIELLNKYDIYRLDYSKNSIKLGIFLA
jgi:hypothetical protein